MKQIQPHKIFFLVAILLGVEIISVATNKCTNHDAKPMT
jgi:hypothetical protein